MINFLQEHWDDIMKIAATIATATVTVASIIYKLSPDKKDTRLDKLLKIMSLHKEAKK